MRVAGTLGAVALALAAHACAEAPRLKLVPGALAAARAVGLAFSPDGKKLLVAGAVFDVATGARETVPGLGDAQSACWSADGRAVLVADGQGVRWVALDGSAPRGVAAQGQVHAVPFGALAVVRDLFDTRVIERRVDAAPRDFQQPPKQILELSPDGKRGVGFGGDAISVFASGATSATLELDRDGAYGASAGVWSPDGALYAALASGERDEVRVWDTATGKIRGRVSVQRADALAFSPDGKRLALATSDQVQVWSADLKRRDWWSGGHQHLEQVAWSPDGKRLAAGACRGRLHVWSTEDGRELHAAGELHPERVALSPDGATLFGLDGAGRVAAWEVATGRRRFGPGGGPREDLAPAPAPDYVAPLPEGTSVGPYPCAQHLRAPVLARAHAGKWLAHARGPGPVELVDATTGVTRTLCTPPAAVHALAFTGDDAGLVVETMAGPERAITVYELASGAARTVRKAPSSSACNLVFAVHASTLRLGPGSAPGELEAIDLSTGQFQPSVPVGARPNGEYALSTSGDQLIADRGDDLVVAHGLPDGPERAWRLPPAHRPRRLAVSADGKRGAAGSGAGRVAAFSGDGAAIVLDGHALGIEDLTFADDGNTLAACSLDATAVWAVPAAGPPAERQLETRVLEGAPFTHGLSSVTALAIAPDRATVATAAHGDGVVRLWDAATGAERRRVDTGAAVNSIAFSTDGALLAVGREAGVALHDGATGAVVWRGPRLEGAPRLLAASPAGAQVAWLEMSGQVTVWDRAAAASRSLRPPRGVPPVAIGFGADGRFQAVLADGRCRAEPLAFGSAAAGAATTTEFAIEDRVVAAAAHGTHGAALTSARGGVKLDWVAGKVDAVEIASPAGRRPRAVALAGAADGVTLAHVTAAGQVAVQPGAAQAPSVPLEPRAVLASANGDTVVAFGATTWAAWSGATGKRIASGSVAGAKARDPVAGALSPDGKRLALAAPGAVELVELPGGQARRLAVRGVPLAFSSTGSLLACGPAEAGPAEVVEVASGRVVHTFADAPRRSRLAAFTEGDRLLVMGGNRPQPLVAYDLVAGTPVAIASPTGSMFLMRHGFGRTLVALGESGGFVVRELRSGKVVRRIPRHLTFGTDIVALSPDEKRLVLLQDRQLAVYELAGDAAPRVRRLVPAERYRGNAVAGHVSISPDARALVELTAAGDVLLHRVK